MMPDDPSATLSGIRERYAHGARITATGRDVCASADDVPLLLAALEAVLKLADEWEAKAAELHDMADRAAGRGADPYRVNEIGVRAETYSTRSRELREAISRELSGTRQTQPGEGGES